MMEDPVKRAPIFKDLKPRLQQDHQSVQPSLSCSNFLSKNGVVVRNALTAAECKAIVDISESKGYQDAIQYCGMYRDRWNDRFMSDDHDLAQFVWDRIKDFIPKTMFVYDSDWKLEKLNSRFRFCKYIGGQGHYFGPHTDGQYIIDSDHRSLLTCMFYLNGSDEFEGGLTNFLDCRTKVVNYSVHPEPGLCVIFPQADLDFFHEGTKVTKGLKYILRTDVMFSRSN